MKTLSNLIKGLQLIATVEGEDCGEFNSQNAMLYIGEVSKYSNEQIDTLGTFGFEINNEYDNFEFDLD